MTKIATVQTRQIAGATPGARLVGSEAGSYKERVLSTRPESLAAYWALDDKSGTTAATQVGTYTGAYTASGGGVITLGTPGIGDNLTAATFNGIDACVGIGSVALGAAWNGNKGSAIAWGKIDSLARWSDGLVAWWFHMRASSDVNYNVVFGKIGTNQIQWRRRSGGAQPVTSVTKTFTTPPTGWFCMGMTWDLETTSIRGYYNGEFVGSSTSGFTTWAPGTFVPDSPNISVLFAGSLTLQEWFGSGAHVAWWNNTVLSDAEMLSLGVL